MTQLSFLDKDDGTVHSPEISFFVGYRLVDAWEVLKRHGFRKLVLVTKSEKQNYRLWGMEHPDDIYCMLCFVTDFKPKDKAVVQKALDWGKGGQLLRPRKEA